MRPVGVAQRFSVGGSDGFDLDQPAGLEQTDADDCPRGAVLACESKSSGIA